MFYCLLNFEPNFEGEYDEELKLKTKLITWLIPDTIIGNLEQELLLPVINKSCVIIGTNPNFLIKFSNIMTSYTEQMNMFLKLNQFYLTSADRTRRNINKKPKE